VRAIVTYRSANASKVTDLETKEIYDTILRKKLKKDGLFAGDFVEGKLVEKKFVIEKILKRKNSLKRPPVANVDSALIIMSVKNPNFDNYLLDNFLAVYAYFNIEPVVIFNKIDLLEDTTKLQDILKIYKDAGYIVDAVSAFKEDTIEKIKNYIKGEVSILAGPSGVGKSSILSKLIGIKTKTNEVSKKLGRGRHTTTSVTLYPFTQNSFIADTPGFSKVEATYFMDKKEVRLYFREFLKYSCKFQNCTHTNEPECGVKEAVKKGEIRCERFKSYLKIIRYYLEELKNICP
jgi:ribosome biogenesis GTPase